jgi:hypothetical protein
MRHHLSQDEVALWHVGREAADLHEDQGPFGQKSTNGHLRAAVIRQDWTAPKYGEAFAASVINAVINGPGWDKTVLLWNLPALTYRDANANAMTDMLDLSFPAFAKAPKLAEPLEQSNSSSLACNVSGPGTIPPPGSVTGP